MGSRNATMFRPDKNCSATLLKSPFRNLPVNKGTERNRSPETGVHVDCGLGNRLFLSPGLRGKPPARGCPLLAGCTALSATG